jgi:predicted GTPase
MYDDYNFNILNEKSKKVGIIYDVMVTGVTGAGKSTTLNNLFKKEICKVGYGCEPETMDIDSYQLNSCIRFWDTPGLGDGKTKDLEHSKKIIDLLYKSYQEDKGWIDLILVIIDGSTRDMGTTYKLLNEIIIPNFQKDRILIAINQADMAMSGRNWDYEKNQPNQRLIDFLDKKVNSVKNRIKEATDINIVEPIYYSAEKNYNIHKLLDLIIDNLPTKKRNLVLN